MRPQIKSQLKSKTKPQGQQAKLKYWILLVSLFLSANAFAKFSATVDRNEVFVGETFSLILKVDKNTKSQPDLSVLNDDFRVISNSSSMSTQIVNGQYSFEKSWTVVLMPLKEGDLIIPEIELDGEKSSKITINVGKPDPNAKPNGDLFIEVTTDKISAFVKEQIIYKVKFFYSIPLSEGSLSEPYASDTLVTMLDKNSTYTTVRDGKRYEVIERHYALFAEKSGVMEINPILFNGRDNSSRRSMSMFSTGKPVRAVSKPVSIEIKPIPQNAIGKDWLPATSVRLAEQWSQPPYTVGEPITRTITLFAEGLSESQIPNIDLGEIENIKTYPEQPQTQTDITPKTIKAIKQIKMALIPTRDGSVRIPEYSLQWFNTETGELEQAKLPPRSLSVDAGSFAAPQIDMKQQLNNGLNDALPKALKNQQASDSIATTEATTPQQQISNRAAPSSFWKFTTGFLALLWLLTVIYFKKHSPSAQKSSRNTVKEAKRISKKDVLAAIKSQNPNLLQRELIQWWNQQNPTHKVNNLSQLQTHLDSKSQKMIVELEQALYQKNTQDFDYKALRKHLEDNSLKPKKQTTPQNSQKLPSLYS